MVADISPYIIGDSSEDGEVTDIISMRLVINVSERMTYDILLIVRYVGEVENDIILNGRIFEEWKSD